jgi:hypothetical protein
MLGMTVVAITQADWKMLAWSVALAVAVPAWLLAFYVPTICGVKTARGNACRNMTQGLLFGCRSADHTWAKFFARFGWRTQPSLEPGESSTDGTAATGSSLVQVRIAEPRQNTITFWLAIAGTLVGLVSAVLDTTSFLGNR